jgi:CRISPR/Cas system endoribonuclease Cas6 (RAMP superfamily)
VELSYVKLYFTFTLNADVADPFTFFGCRGDFDAAFRRAVSCRRPDCAGCLTAGSCPYPANFGQKIAKDPEAVKRHQKPPLPFVFDFPIPPPAPNRGEALELGITLFGTAVQNASRYISAVRFLLQAVPATITKIEAGAPGGGRSVVAAGDNPALPLLSALDPAQPGPLAPDAVSIHFLTPLKLVNEGRLAKSIAFAPFARSLMRRVSSLAYYYERAEPSLDYRWLSQLSDSVKTVCTDCRFVSWGGRPAGITGRISFEGNLEPFHLFLQVGVATHLGKSASFGFGAYRIDC